MKYSNTFQLAAILSFTFWFMLASSATAATIELTISTRMVDVTGAGVVSTNDFKNPSIDTVATGNTSLSDQSSQNNPGEIFAGEVQSGDITASASGNIETGELKSSIVTSYTGPFAQNAIGGDALVEISETFAVTGTGFLTVLLGYDGFYDLATVPEFGGGGQPGIGFQAQAQLDMLRNANQLIGTDNFSINQSLACPGPGGCPAAADTFDGLLSVTNFINDVNTSSITIFTSLLTQISTGKGSVDMSQTGELFLIFDPTLTLTPMDTNFLADPAFTSAVPTPAALPLLAGGLGLLGLLGWRRKRNAPTA